MYRYNFRLIRILFLQVCCARMTKQTEFIRYSNYCQLLLRQYTAVVVVAAVVQYGHLPTILLESVYFFVFIISITTGKNFPGSQWGESP